MISRINPQLPVDFCGVAIIGESPGKNEIEQGKPFVGRSGALLDSVLSEVGIDRSRCLVSNVFLSRPNEDKIDLFFRPRHVDGDGKIVDDAFVQSYGLYRNKVVCDDNRQDMERLADELFQHQPKLILTLGATALWRVTGLNGITAARGQWVLLHRYNHMVGVMPTWHPSAVLRDRSAKLPQLVADIKLVKDVLDGLVA